MDIIVTLDLVLTVGNHWGPGYADGIGAQCG